MMLTAVGLTIAYVAVGALLLNLNLATRRPVAVKVLAILLVSALYAGVWYGHRALMGWATTQQTAAVSAASETAAVSSDSLSVALTGIGGAWVSSGWGGACVDSIARSGGMAFSGWDGSGAFSAMGAISNFSSALIVVLSLDIILSIVFSPHLHRRSHTDRSECHPSDELHRSSGFPR